MSETRTRERPSRFARLRAASDRVPTKWFAAIGTGLFLAVTAAFGGLNTVPETPIAHIQANEVHDTGMFDMTVEEAFLFRALAPAGVIEEDGTDVLALRVTLDNVTQQPQATTLSSKIFAVSIPGAEFVTTALLSDGTPLPVIQPDIPTQVAVVWRVPAGTVTADTPLTVTISDPVAWTGAGLSASGSGWEAGSPTATLELPISDRRDQS